MKNENRTREKKRIDLKNMMLASKMAIFIGSIIFVVFMAFIVMTIFMTKSALMQSGDSEFNNMSEKNAVKIQSPFDTALSTGRNLQYYSQRMFDEYSILSATDPKRTTKEKSSVYDAEIEQFNGEMERYYINTITSLVSGSEDIMGASILFEPDAFDSAIRDYSIYIDEKDIDNVTSMGAYEDYKDQIYYKTAKEIKDIYFTPPYDYNGVKIISATYPIIYQDEVKGVIAVDINVNNFVKIVQTDERYPSLYQDILTKDGTIVFDSTTPEGDFVGTNLSEWLTPASAESMLGQFEKGEAFTMVDKNTTGVNICRYFYPISAGNDTWWALIGVNKSEKEAAVTKTVIWLLLLTAVAMIIIILSIITTLRKMINPIGTVVKAAESIAAGDLNVELQVTSRDEIGILTGVFKKTVESLKAVIDDISSVLNDMAAGNLDVETKAEYPGDFGQMKEAVNAIIGNLNDFMLHVVESSDQVSGGASQIAGGAQSLAEGATEQASAIEELQATVTDITAQVDKNTANAKEANQTAQVAGKELAEGNTQMKRMLEAMEEINKTSNEIKNVISTIEDIAEQTNLLSLNASIEAARAGEAGRGFAVVADQVGKLASESAEATKNTASLIEASIEAVSNGKSIADDTAAVIDTAVGKVEEVVRNVENISVASDRQSSSLNQVSQGVEQIASVIEENSAMAEESASASEELSAQAQMLDELVAKFKIKNN